LEIPITFDADADGFLRRGCPNCGREFKWFQGETAERPDDFEDPEMYHCPYCGQPSDDWWTERQREYAEEVANAAALRLASDELSRAFKGMRGVTYKPGRPGPEMAEPAPFVDPNDMVMVASPCHAFESVKVSENWSESLRCLVCGREFAV
jgi:DNA-directed RNA polymerase subunit RPC12/RpoP